MVAWKGVLLAGGTGSRLQPLTYAVNKHLLPVYDKPMIYYPLTTLMLAGIRDFVVVSSPESLPDLKRCLGDGQRWGLTIEYAAQNEPRGIAHGLIAAERELEAKNVALVLADNIFYGTGLPSQLRDALETNRGATIFGYEVIDPQAFGVVTLREDGSPESLEEKPQVPRSNLAVPGIYFFDNTVLDIARSLKPSARGELEITDVSRAYLQRQSLRVLPLGRGTAWLDGGTPGDLFEAGLFIRVLEARTGLKIACPEEVAYRMRFINLEQLASLVKDDPKTEYATYIRTLVDRERKKEVRPK
jgi:glucose-1-phosphate thymidylyltransferase